MRLPVVCLVSLLSLPLFAPTPADARECADDARRGRPYRLIALCRPGGASRPPGFPQAAVFSVD